MAQYLFGTGQLFAAVQGGGNTNAPLRLGALQDVSVEFAGDVKQLHGQYQYALDVARGKTKVDGKFSFANIDIASYNAAFFNSSAGVVTGQKRQAINEAATVPTTPFQVTVANAATFFRDLGVTSVLTGLPLKQVASAPAAGQYSVVQSTGIYTFNTADTGKAMLINYIWTDAANGGTVNLTNDLMGTAPMFEMILSQTYKSKIFTLCLYAVVCDKLTLPLKGDEHLVNDVSFQAQDNGLGAIGFLSTTSAVGGGA